MSDFRRNIMMFTRPVSGALPYDAEVEYIEGSGTQYISIPASVTSAAVITIDGYITTSNRELFSLPLNGAFHTYYQFNIESGATYYRFFNSASINAGSGLLNARHTWGCGASLYKDGTLVASKTPNQTSTRDSIVLLKGSHGTTGGRIYSFHFLEGNIEIDAIPVRKNGVGYLYDKISGQLYGNSGTGDFAVGNDVN